MFMHTLSLMNNITKFPYSQISETDSLPKCVCQECWTITEAFHELYQKSKLAQEKYLNPVIVKRETDSDDIWSINQETTFAEELCPPMEVVPLKLEANVGGESCDLRRDHLESNFIKCFQIDRWIRRKWWPHGLPRFGWQ